MHAMCKVAGKRFVTNARWCCFFVSIWVLMHVDTKTMHRVTDKIRAELAPWVRDPPKWALSEERRQASSGRIARLHGSAAYQKCGLEPLDRDLDMNQHVNNVKYITWTLEVFLFNQSPL
jgi:acyl-ACP thioesterase